MPTQKAPTIIAKTAMRMSATIGGAWPTSGMASAPAANPPSTSAPSPPIMMRPMRAGIATASAVRIKRRRALQRILERERGAEPAAPDVSDEIGRRLADRQQKDGEQRRRDKERKQRNDDIFRIDAQPIGKVRPGRARRDRIDHGARGAGCDRRIRHRLVPFEP